MHLTFLHGEYFQLLKNYHFKHVAFSADSCNVFCNVDNVRRMRENLVYLKI